MSSIVLIVFKKNGPIRMQNLSVCQEGSDGRFFAIVTLRPRDFSVELKMLLEWPYCFKVLDSNVLFTEKRPL